MATPQDPYTVGENWWASLGKDTLTTLGAVSTGGMSLLPKDTAATLGASFGGGAAAVLDIMPGKGGGNFQAYLQGLTADKQRLHDARQKEYDRTASLERQMISTGGQLLGTKATVEAQIGMSQRRLAQEKTIHNEKLKLEQDKFDLLKKETAQIELQALNADTMAWTNKHRELSGPQLAKVLGSLNAYVKIQSQTPELLDQLNNTNSSNHQNAIQQGIAMVHNLVGADKASGVLELTILASVDAAQKKQYLQDRFGASMSDDEFNQLIHSGAVNDIHQSARDEEAIALNSALATTEALLAIEEGNTKRLGTGTPITFEEAETQYDAFVEARNNYNTTSSHDAINYAKSAWVPQREGWDTRVNSLETQLIYNRKLAFQTDAARLFGTKGIPTNEMIAHPIWQGLAEDPSLWGEGFLPAMQDTIANIDALITKIESIPAHLRQAYRAENEEVDDFLTWMEDSKVDNGTEAVGRLRETVRKNTKPGHGGIQQSGIGAQESLITMGILQLGAEHNTDDISGEVKELEARYNNDITVEETSTSLQNAFDDFGLPIPEFTKKDTELNMITGVDGKQYLADSEIDKAANYLVAGFLADAGMPHLDPTTGTVTTPTLKADGTPIDQEPYAVLSSLRTRLNEKRNALIQAGAVNSPEFFVIDQAKDEVEDRLRRVQIQSDQIGVYDWEGRELTATQARSMADDMVKLRTTRNKQSLEGLGLTELLYAIRSLNPSVAHHIDSLEEELINQADDYPGFSSRTRIKKALSAVNKTTLSGDKVTLSDGRAMLIENLLAHGQEPGTRKDAYSNLTQSQGGPRFRGVEKTQEMNWLFAGLGPEQKARMVQLLDVLADERDTLVGMGDLPGGAVDLNYFKPKEAAGLPDATFYTSKEEKQLLDRVKSRMHQGPSLTEIENAVDDATSHKNRFLDIVTNGGSDQYDAASAQTFAERWAREEESLTALAKDYTSVQSVINTYVAGPTRGFFLNLKNRGLARDTKVLDPKTVTEKQLKDIFITRLGATMNERLGMEEPEQLKEFVQEIAGVAAELSPIDLYARMEEAFGAMAPAIIKKGYTQADVGRLHVVETADEQTDSNVTLMEAYTMNDELMSFTYAEIITQTPQLAPFLPGKGYNEADDELKAVLLVLAEQEAHNYRPSEAQVPPISYNRAE